MKLILVATVVLSSIWLAGCLETLSFGSVSRAPDASIPKHHTPDLYDCVHVPFPQCSGG